MCLFLDAFIYLDKTGLGGLPNQIKSIIRRLIPDVPNHSIIPLGSEIRCIAWKATHQSNLRDFFMHRSILDRIKVQLGAMGSVEVICGGVTLRDIGYRKHGAGNFGDLCILRNKVYPVIERCSEINECFDTVFGVTYVYGSV